MTDETKPRPWECLRFGKEIVVSNAAEVKHRKSLLRLISARLGAERRKLRRTEGVENRNRLTCEIKRLQELRTQLRQAPAVAGADHPKVRAAIHRAIKTKRAWIKRHLQPDNVLARNERKALESQLKDLDDLETVLFGVQRRRVARSFPEYPGKTPTADEIIHNAVIWRCLETGKAHLILPKLAAMFPENYSDALAEQIRVDPRVRQVRDRIKAK